MKRQIQRLLGLTALALGLGLGFSAPAMAAYTGSCANVPSGAQTGNAIIGTAGTACTIPSTGANFTGTITINGSTITTTGAITAGGTLAVTGTSTVNMKALTGSSVAVNTNANITTTTINSSSSLNVATTAGTVTTGALTGGNATLQVTGTGNVTTAAVVSGGAINVTSSAGKVTTTTLTSGSSSDIVVMSNSDLQTGKVLASGGFGATSSTGLIKVTSTITTNTGANGGNVLLQANGNISSGAISTSGGAKSGGVEIDANMGGASSLFTIGSATANGVASINTSNTTAGGTSPTFVGDGLFVTNGTASSTGGITVTSMSAINVAASASRSGLIFLNAQNGTLTLPTGTLSSIGASGQGAGEIALLANTVTTASGTIVSASQASGVAGTQHGVVIAANTINVAGTGLQVLGNGDGITGQSNSAFAEIVPQGATTISSTRVLDNLQWSVTTAGPYNLPVAITGSGAAFTLSANGSNATASVLAYPITLTNGATTITSKGSTNHQVVLQNNGTLSGTNGLVLTGNGAVLIDASGAATGDLAGAVNLVVDKANITVPTFTIQSNAAGSSGFGGNIFFQSSALTLGSATTSKIQANGPTGNGNGGSITVFPGNITNLKLGTNAGDLQVLANGGTTGGDGGSINVNPFPGSITIDTLNAVSAVVQGANGNGGNITLIGNPGLTINPTLTGTAINVDGKGTGNGGKIKIWAVSPLTVGSAAGNISLSATNNGGTGNGGAIELGYITSLTSSATISVSGGSASNSNGNGGVINFHDLGQFTFSGLVSANGSGTGTGGTITVSQTSSLPLDLSNSEIQANAGATSGDGGNISITAFQMIVSSATFQAVGIGTGTGGEIDLNITDPNSVIDIAKATSIQATGGNNGFGGTVSVTDTAALPDPLAVIDVYPLETGVAIAATHTAASPRSGPTGTGGVIKVTRQGVTCQFYPSTTFPAWPKGYFNCAHAGGATLEDKAAINIASTIPASGRNTLSNSQIWVWGSFGDLNKFTKGKAQDVGESGNTTPNANNTTFYVNVFENVSTLPNPLTVTQLKETTAHEFGHVNDFVKSESGGASYNSWVQTDYAALDYDKILLTPQTSHRRAPCSTSPYDGRPGPFVGVIDQNSGLAFCNGTVFANSLYLDAANGNNPYRNSWVLQTSSPYFTGANPVGWLEVYAQTFAFSSYAVNLTNRNDYFVYTLDGVEKNGLFACVQIWSTALVNGSTTPPSQVGCPAVPTWYPPLLGHKDSHD